MIIEIQHRTHVQFLTYEDFEQRIREGEISRETLVRFDVVTGDKFVPAGNLELYSELADPQRMAFRTNLTRAGVPVLTAILVGLQVRVYLASWTPGVELWLQERFTNWAPGVYEMGEFWRLFSYGMLHTSFTHILFNLCFLAYTGYHLERAMGRANLFLLYFGSVFTGGLLSMFMAPARPSLGASGGDFGLLAAAVVLGWKHWEAIPFHARKYFGWALMPYPAISILTGLQSENVDNWSHLGGLLGGMALMTLLDPEVLPHRQRVNRRVRAASWALIGLTCAVLWWAGTRILPLELHDKDDWQVSLPAYWTAETWTFTGDYAIRSPTQRAQVSMTTVQNPRPVDADQAADNVTARIRSGARAVEVSLREPVRVGEHEGRHLRIHFELAGEPMIIDAIVVARGVQEHRVQFQSQAQAAPAYAPLFDAITESIVIPESSAVAAAKAKTLSHPRSWEPAAELGEALYSAGKPEAALAAHHRALSLSPDQPRALVGLLRVHADYGLPGAADVARGALAAARDHPAVVVAAADALATAGLEDEAIAAMDRAWEDFPGDRALRRARLRWGLSVDAGTADKEAGTTDKEAGTTDKEAGTTDKAELPAE